MEEPSSSAQHHAIPRERVNPFLGRPITDWAGNLHAQSKCASPHGNDQHSSVEEGYHAPELQAALPPPSLGNPDKAQQESATGDRETLVADGDESPASFLTHPASVPETSSSAKLPHPESTPTNPVPSLNSAEHHHSDIAPTASPTSATLPRQQPVLHYTSANLASSQDFTHIPLEFDCCVEQAAPSACQLTVDTMQSVELSCSSGDEDWERRPPAERWPPLGANDADEQSDHQHSGSFEENRRSSLSSADLGRLRKLEEEQEHLNNSLMALTTHFAQVQFRLRQIVEAPTEEKEQLLHDLEAFAFRGIPDVRQYKLADHEQQDLTEEWRHQEMVETQRVRQRHLMQQLKAQLEDLEHYAYETGEAGLPSSVVLEKQRVIIDELKGKLNIDIDNLDRMTSEDLKSLVDCAVGQLINPLKMKEQLVNQLKTQVQDLERFISFLQGDGDEGAVCDASCSCHGSPGGRRAVTCSRDETSGADPAVPAPASTARTRRRSARHRTAHKQQEMHKDTSTLMQKALTLLQLVTLTQFSCGRQQFDTNQLKKTPRGNHWGDLRARLEVAVSVVSELARESLRQQESSDPGTDETESEPAAARGEPVTLAVRKQLAPALRDLIQHGLLQVSRSRSVVPFAGCLSASSRAAAPRPLHAWDVLLVYYRLKRGAQFNATPQRRLSQSFALDVVGGTAITNKHTMLSAIGNIIATHTPLKRSQDAHFKAFVCAGLNARKLSWWLRLMLRTQAVTEEYYQPWSYVVSTGFEDALSCLARLEKHRFQLPEDLAVRQLKNIRDAF